MDSIHQVKVCPIEKIIYWIYYTKCSGLPPLINMLFPKHITFNSYLEDFSVYIIWYVSYIILVIC